MTSRQSRRLFLAPLLVAVGALGATRAAAAEPGFRVPGYELVYSYPVETSLDEPDLRLAQDVWPEMFDRARRTIDLEEFYASPKAGEPLEASLQALERAGKRGVKIRVLLEKKFEKQSQEGIERLKAIPGLELRLIDWARIEGLGIVHAKYFVVDSTQAYMGSQNFDWRSLKHIHELGLRVSDSAVVSGLKGVFDRDWLLAASSAPAVSDNASPPSFDRSRSSYLVASPWRLNPPGIGDSEAELVRLIGEAQHELRIQLQDYGPYTWERPHRYYGVIDSALRDAALRGVHVMMLVADWDTTEPAVHYLQSLAVLPNVEVRIISIPQAKEGPIPFARVAHSKYMVADGRTLWLGTSNWMAGYLTRYRDVEAVVHDPDLAGRVRKIHEHVWTSSYAAPIDVLKKYPTPRLWHD